MPFNRFHFFFYSWWTGQNPVFVFSNAVFGAAQTPWGYICSSCHWMETDLKSAELCEVNSLVYTFREVYECTHTLFPLMMSPGACVCMYSGFCSYAVMGDHNSRCWYGSGLWLSLCVPEVFRKLCTLGVRSHVFVHTVIEAWVIGLCIYICVWPFSLL